MFNEEKRWGQGKKKAHVAMEKRVCLVTGKEYETGQLLLATTYSKNGEPLIDLDEHNVTGNGFCPEVQDKFDNGYIALVCLDESKSDINKSGNTVHPKDAYRTGRIIYIKREAADELLTGVDVDKFCYIDNEAADKIEEISKGNWSGEEPDEKQKKEN